MLAPYIPTTSTGPCPLTVAGPSAAWIPLKELTRTYLQRVLRGWAGKGPAATPQRQRSSLSSAPLADHTHPTSVRYQRCKAASPLKASSRG
ncbi:hypothetical protein DGN16_17715 [Xanthomonas citri pv. fuscans]|nr:hypothetical protein DGN16_17715 [Xanthomonas citri pv. fuscans]QWN08919.1 hypothetical protein DGN11_17225 [Xanthomonas citri pv. fuscans]QWN13108.1 hypothetical protein DGN07_17665 [Xanthomonas citri pv. fuscans]